MKNLICKIFPGACLCTLLFASPILSGCAQTEKTEGVTADITAAQMEGRNAARPFITRDWKDTTGLSLLVNDVNKKREKYIAEKKPKCADAFDSTFYHTIKSVMPELVYMIRNEK